MDVRGFLISCILIYFHHAIGNRLTSNHCSQGCPTEPHISCSVTLGAVCSSFSGFTSSKWPGAPGSFDLSVRGSSGNTSSVLTWTLPDDASFRHITGFLLTSTLLQGIVDPVCVYINLSSTSWQATDKAKQIMLPWDCIGISRGKEYYISLNSLPLPKDGSLTKNGKSLFASVPELDDGSAKNWSPLITVTQQNYTNKPGVNIGVKFTLAPELDFTNYTVSILNGTNLSKLVYKEELAPRTYPDAEHVFEHICEGSYKVGVLPYKKNKNKKKCTCEGVYPSCKLCLVTTVRIDVYPKVYCTQGPSTVTTTTAKLTEKYISDIKGGFSSSVASSEPMINGQRQASRNNTYMVIILVVGAFAVLCVLLLLLVSFMLCKRHSKSKMSIAGNQGDSYYGQGADSIQTSYIPPDSSSKFSMAGTEYMRQFNDDQSQAANNGYNQHFSGNDTKSKACDIDNMGYEF